MTTTRDIKKFIIKCIKHSNSKWNLPNHILSKCIRRNYLHHKVVGKHFSILGFQNGGVIHKVRKVVLAESTNCSYFKNPTLKSCENGLLTHLDVLLDQKSKLNAHRNRLDTLCINSNFNDRHVCNFYADNLSHYNQSCILATSNISITATYFDIETWRRYF